MHPEYHGQDDIIRRFPVGTSASDAIGPMLQDTNKYLRATGQAYQGKIIELLGGIAQNSPNTWSEIKLKIRRKI